MVAIMSGLCEVSLVLKTICTRQPERQLLWSSYNHYPILMVTTTMWGNHLLALKAWKFLTATLKWIVKTPFQMFWGFSVYCGVRWT